MVAPNAFDPSQHDDGDPMGPPKVPCEVECIHCGCRYMSSDIRWQHDPDGPDGGWWVCPIDGCNGAGFCFDIFPTDPEVARSHGVETWDEDDENWIDDLDPADESDDADFHKPPTAGDADRTGDRQSFPPSRMPDEDIPF